MAAPKPLGCECEAKYVQIVALYPHTSSRVSDLWPYFWHVCGLYVTCSDIISVSRFSGAASMIDPWLAQRR